MDQALNESGDMDNFESHWDNPEEDLIPIDNRHLSDEVRDAARRADEALAREEARIETLMNSFDQEFDQEALVEPAPLSAENSIDEAASDATQSDDPGAAIYPNSPGTESSEFGDLIVNESEYRGGPERMG